MDDLFDVNDGRLTLLEVASEEARCAQHPRQGESVTETALCLQREV